MNLVIIGPGIMPIPPKGWGAVESLIWDYKIFIYKYHPHIKTHIVNKRHPEEIINDTNNLKPDVVHIQYDDYAHLAQYIRCKKIYLTSHYGYLDQLDTRREPFYMRIFINFIQSNCTILCLSPSIANMYVKYGCPSHNVIVQHNGANDEVFKYTLVPKYPNKSIYLAKIDQRKRQAVYQSLSMIDFVGNHADYNFNKNIPNYLGEWSKEHLYQHLTDYANLILLSDGEAHPLVCCEALICGLGLVISEYAAANLYTSLHFIDVIPTNKLNDLNYISEIITKNQNTSIIMRDQIRKYGIDNFSWKHVLDSYVKKIITL
jgi:glycosyltransferase involved in cell wall biosynthesis